jgi:hypothetical protein
MQTAQPLSKAARQEEMALRALLAERVRAPYGLFFLAGEGRCMPNGMEELSGYAIDASARVFSFWVKWDQQSGAPCLARWRQTPIEGRWRRSPQYHHARAEAGLPPDMPTESLPGSDA